MLISLLFFLVIGAASVITYVVLRVILRYRTIVALRGATGACAFVPFAFVGAGLSGLFFPERVLSVGGELVTATTAGLAVVVGDFGALLAVVLFMRFIEKKDFGQIQS